MNRYLFLAFLCMLTIQQKVLLLSNPNTTVLKSPVGHSVVVEDYHTIHNPNFLGNGAQWIYKNGSDSWPANDTAFFQAYFYADCQSPVTLMITADDAFIASLNFGKVVEGNNWTRKYNFTLNNVHCGNNTLMITVSNAIAGTPAALIFAVIQDQKSCYTCKNSLSFYNAKTCQCQCLQELNCFLSNPSFTWIPYPSCLCGCKQKKQCPQRNSWNEEACSCKCIIDSCLPGFQQDQTTCSCKKKCVDKAVCSKGKVWNADQCKCVCQLSSQCSYPLTWNEQTCFCGPAGYL